MVQTVSLEPTVADDTSDDIVVAEGASAVIGIYTASGSLSAAGSFDAVVFQVTPGAPNAFVNLNHSVPSLEFKGPNTFRVFKPTTRVPVGVFSE